MRKAKQSAAKNVMVLMVDSADHVTGKTGLTLAISASKDGAAFASISPTVTERGDGWYALALTASDTDTLGDLALHVTGTAADPADLVLLVEAGATDADVSSRLATAGYTAPPTVAAVRTEIDANSTKLDVAVSSRLATASYTAPNNAGIASILAAVDTEVAAILATVDTEVAAIKARTDNLPADTATTLATVLGYVDELETRLTATRAGLLDNLDVAVSTRLATAGYTAPDNAGIAAIQADGFGSADRALLQAVEQDALGARTLNLGSGQETISRTARTDKVRTLFKDAAKTQPVSSASDPVLGTSEAA